MEARLLFGKHMEDLKLTSEWYAQHVVWRDICNDALPKTQRRANLQALARKGGSGCTSPGSETLPCNMRGKTEDLKLCGTACLCVF